MEDVFLKCTDVSFSYSPKRKVIQGISLSLGKNKTLAVVGASGCGKSTFLRIISGILTEKSGYQSSGSVTVSGLRPDEYMKSGKLAFMFQEATLLPHLTVRENIALPLRIKGIIDEEKVNALINVVGLQEYSSFLPKQLSGGMKTRVALARSFVTHPELLLLDEPFSSLDIAWKSKLYKELEKLREQMETTFIIVTHDVQEALLLADSIVVLNSLGEIEMQKEIVSGYTIKDRVDNISGYMNSIYESYLLPIQDAIINGQSKKNEELDHIPVA